MHPNLAFRAALSPDLAYPLLLQSVDSQCGYRTAWLSAIATKIYVHMQGETG